MTDNMQSDLTTGDPKPSTVDVLKKARALIEKPENWWNGLYPVKPGTACAMIAVARSAHSHIAYQDAEIALQKAIGGSVIGFNDTHSHPDVLSAFDRAIELAASTEPGSPVAIEPSNAEGVVQ